MRSTMRYRLALPMATFFGISLGFVLILALPSIASAQKLVVGYSGVTAIQAPFWIIKDAGYLKQEGLDANLVYIAASSTMSLPNSFLTAFCNPLLNESSNGLHRRMLAESDGKISLYRLG